MSIIKTEAYIVSSSSVVGGQEAKGPIGGKYDICDLKDDTFGGDTWEKSESEMQRIALKTAIEKAGLKESDIEAVFAGDLINQCISSVFGLLNFDIPFLGIFGACSTCAEGIIMSAMLSTFAKTSCASVTSSHNCTAERQFRFPIEYGALRTPTSQWTATAAGAYIVSSANVENSVKIEDAMPGKIVDSGVTDANNMGAAMAPAAADTIERYLSESGKTAYDFDVILTGDLGLEGSSILIELLKKKGIDISSCHNDCGIEIYDIKKQDMHSGGSGCGCSAAVLSAKYLSEMKEGRIKNMLFVGTGALMNSMSVQQGNSIPGIAHLVHLTI